MIRLLLVIFMLSGACVSAQEKTTTAKANTNSTTRTRRQMFHFNNTNSTEFDITHNGTAWRMRQHLSLFRNTRDGFMVPAPTYRRNKKKGII